jgi:hypothetical protein
MDRPDRRIRRGLRRGSHPDRQDDRLHAAELQPALDRECGLVVERAREQVLALEHELAREHHAAPELLDQVEAHVLELGDQIGAEGVTVLGVVAHAIRQVDILLEVGTHLPLERRHVLNSLELPRIHQPHRAEHEVLEVARKQPLDREQGVDAEAAIGLDQHDRRGAVRGELGLGARLGERQVGELGVERGQQPPDAAVMRTHHEAERDQPRRDRECHPATL